jgi:hypothetical protein
MRLPNSCVRACRCIAGLEGDPSAIAMREERIREARQAVSFFCRHNSSWPAPSSC